jgi:multiple antibiotic resistance protein
MPGSTLSLGMIFTAFFVMLGPLKLLGPFAALTSDMEQGAARRLAMRAFAFACAGGLVAGILGQNILMSWRISVPALHFTAGIVLFLVAIKAILAEYEPAPKASKPTVPSRNPALSPLAFPTILTPYGIAFLIVLMASTDDHSREAYVVIVFLVVMVLNWLAMLYARTIIHHAGTALAVLGAVLSVLQVALAVQIIVNAVRGLSAAAV